MKHRELLQHTSVLFLGTLVGNIAAYVLQISMAQSLSVEAFGDFNALLALMVLIGVPFSTVEQYVGRNVSHYHARNEPKKVNQVVLSSGRAMFFIMALITFSAALMGEFATEQLKLNNPYSFYFLLFAVFASVATPLTTSIYQGLHRFLGVAGNFALGGTMKLLLAVLLVKLGFSVNGALVGMGLGTLLVGGMFLLYLRPYFSQGVEALGFNFRTGLKALAPIFWANLAFLFLTQTDILLVKRLFSPEQAGLYSVASVLGKIILYLPSSLTLLLFPQVAAAQSRKESPNKMLAQSMGVTLLVTVTASIGLYFTAWFFVPFLFGEEYAAVTPVAEAYGFVSVPMAMLMMLLNYNLARGWYHFIAPFFFFFIVQASLIWMFHESFYQVLGILLIGNMGAALTSWAQTIRRQGHEQRTEAGTGSENQ